MEIEEPNNDYSLLFLDLWGSNIFFCMLAKLNQIYFIEVFGIDIAMLTGARRGSNIWSTFELKHLITKVLF